MIRDARVEDVAAIRACVDAAYSPYIAMLDGKPAAMRVNYDALVAAGEMHVYESAGKIVSCMALHSEGEVLHIGNLAVMPEHQGAGIGSEMLDYAEEVARADGLLELRLFTNEVMIENLDFYTNSGFVETERRVEDGFKRVFFAKPVEPVPVGECLACDLTAGVRPLPGGLIHREDGWLVEHCVGPLGLGTLVVKPARHVTAVADLDEDEAVQMGRLLRDTAAVVTELSDPAQVYVSLWSHERGEPGHVHFVVQPIGREAIARFGSGPDLQAAMFEANELPDPVDMAQYAEKARELFQA